MTVPLVDTRVSPRVVSGLCSANVGPAPHVASVASDVRYVIAAPIAYRVPVTVPEVATSVSPLVVSGEMDANVGDSANVNGRQFVPS